MNLPAHITFKLTLDVCKHLKPIFSALSKAQGTLITIIRSLELLKNMNSGSSD